MRQPARQHLLLLLSDGKPNDVDEYDGRYGATSGPWTTQMFVEAVYRDLSRR